MPLWVAGAYPRDAKTGRSRRSEWSGKNPVELFDRANNQATPCSMSCFPPGRIPNFPKCTHSLFFGVAMTLTLLLFVEETEKYHLILFTLTSLCMHILSDLRRTYVLSMLLLILHSYKCQPFFVSLRPSQTCGGTKGGSLSCTRSTRAQATLALL